jgi:hypothetical protein
LVGSVAAVDAGKRRAVDGLVNSLSDLLLVVASAFHLELGFEIFDGEALVERFEDEDTVVLRKVEADRLAVLPPDLFSLFVRASPPG